MAVKVKEERIRKDRGFKWNIEILKERMVNEF
jgi:hypothetical protein